MLARCQLAGPTTPRHAARAASALRTMLTTLRALRQAEARLVVLSAEGLAQLRHGREYLQLGHARFEDLCREELGLHPRTAQRRVALARLFDRWPDMQGAFLAGRLSACQALAVAPLLTRESAPSWAAVAGRMSVREIQQQVRNRAPGEAAPAIEPPGDEEFRTISFTAPVVARLAFDEAIERTRMVLGWEAPRHTCVEALLIESAPGAIALAGGSESREPLTEAGAGAPPEPMTARAMTPARSAELQRAVAAAWRCVRQIDSLTSRVTSNPLTRLQGLHQLEQQHRPLRLALGRFVKVVDECGGRSAVMAELGCSERMARELLAEARTFEDDDDLTRAFETRLIDLGQAAMVRRVQTGTTRTAWIRRAGQVTVRQFQREVRLIENLAEVRTRPDWGSREPFPRIGLEAELRRELSRRGQFSRDVNRALRPWRGAPVADPATDHRAMKRLEVLAELVHLSVYPDGVRQTLSGDEAARTIRFRAPAVVAQHWRAAMAWVRQCAREPALPDWAAAILLIRCALEIWEPGQAPSHHRILNRDDYRCQAPGCSQRRHLEVHHIQFRSRGGRNQAENLITLCSTHHREVIHGGHLTLTQWRGTLAWRSALGRSRADRWEARHAPAGITRPVNALCDRPASPGGPVPLQPGRSLPCDVQISIAMPDSNRVFSRP